MFGKSEPSSTLSPRSRQPRQQVARERRHLLEEVGERHRGVEVRPLVAPRRASRKSAYSGAPRCATTAVSVGCRSSSRRSGPGPVWSLPTGPELAWMTTGVPASASAPQASSSSGSTRSKSPTWTCTLNTSMPGGDQLARRTSPHAGLGVERRRPQALGDAGRRTRAAQSLRYAAMPGPVRVGQRAEAAYAERAQLRDPLVVVAAVADRPRPADQRAGRVELRADLAPGCAAAGSARARRTARAGRGRATRPATSAGSRSRHSMPLSAAADAPAASRSACRSASACRLS